MQQDDLAFEITPQDVKQRIDRGEPVHLIDVRRPDEHAMTRIEGAELIPMDTIPRHVDQLEEWAESGPLIVFCHHGIRSANVVNWLRGQGVAACQSMAGGIERWSTEVDPSVPRY
jgi:rhodanese-related sulfurtransferase